MSDSTNTADNEDRGLPSVNKSKLGKGSNNILVLILVALTIAGLVAINGGFSSNDESEGTHSIGNNEIRNNLPELKAPVRKVVEEQGALPAPRFNPDLVVKTNNTPPPAPFYPSVQSKKKEMTPRERKLSSSIFASGSRGSAGSSSNSNGSERGQSSSAYPYGTLKDPNADTASPSGFSGAFGGQLEVADGLNANLKATTLNGAKASVIKNRSFIITRGTFLDCSLETAISSDVPGMTSCRMTRDVYSSDGKVLLLERGSRITGQFRGGLQRGKARIFVLWSRVETPNGVVINIDSPGTDALGRSGHSGHIDNHFFERFGGAIMLSLIDDIGAYVSRKAANGNPENTITFGNTSEAATDAAGIALENSINIPPTLLKNQGEHISVFVSRDLDFTGVYELDIIE